MSGPEKVSTCRNCGEEFRSRPHGMVPRDPDRPPEGVCSKRCWLQLVWAEQLKGPPPPIAGRIGKRG